MVGGISLSDSSNLKASDLVTSNFLEIRQGPLKAPQLREIVSKSIHKPPYPSQRSKAQTLSHTNTNEFTNTRVARYKQVTQTITNKQIKQSTFSETNNLQRINKFIQFNCLETNTIVKHKIKSIEENILKQIQTQQIPKFNTNKYK